MRGEVAPCMAAKERAGKLAREGSGWRHVCIIRWCGPPLPIHRAWYGVQETLFLLNVVVL